MSNKNDHDIYIIPPNFIESGTFFGGMFRARNVIEAGILAFAIGVPVFMFVPFGLTTRIIILCLTALPAALVALIGISGESLSEFLIIFLKYLRNRRIVGGDGQQSNEQAPPMKRPGRHLKQRAPKEKESRPPKRRRSGESDFPAEFDEVRSYEIREKLRPKKKPKKELSSKKAKKKPNKRKEKACPPKRPAHIKEQPPACLNPVADYLPIEKIQNGIIYTKDHRYVKVVEVVPINFMLRSAREQRNIIYSFVSYLKISPVKLQIKVLTRRADINRHLDTVRREMAQEKNEQCRLMQEDYLSFVQQIGAREAVTRRFFLIFEYEPWNNTRRSEQEEEAIQSLQSAVHTASNYLRQCGNEVIIPENEDEFTVDVLYNLLCRNESVIKPLALRAQEVVAQYAAKGRESEIDHIPAAEFAAPKSIDFTHGSYLCIDGLYYAYLLIPSDGYKTQVPAGWLSLIVNAGDGWHAHPTQALLDSYALRQVWGNDFAGKTLCILGDIDHSRVARSNLYLLNLLGAKVRICAPRTLLPAGVDSWNCDVYTNVEEAVRGVDAVMCLRLQLERQEAGLLPDLMEYSRRYCLTKKRLALAKPGAYILHPGPMNRGLEIADDIADTPQSLVLNQVSAGVAVRMAILYLLTTRNEG